MNHPHIKQFNALIVVKAAGVLSCRENEGTEAGKALWKELDRMLTNKRDALSAEVLDLVLQLEFFFEEHPESDLSDLQRALYVAQVALQK